MKNDFQAIYRLVRSTAFGICAVFIVSDYESPPQIINMYTLRTKIWRAIACQILVAFALLGCADRNYLREADQQAMEVIAERAGDPRWNLESYTVAVDDRSRFYDGSESTDVARPTDDVYSNLYMHRVNGYDGWEYWDEDGVTGQFTNEQWQEKLAGYVEFDEEGNIKLNAEASLKLAYIHSPEYQRQKEALYLAALDVTAERFRLDSQYFGGYNTNYRHRGIVNPAGLRVDPTTGNTILFPASTSRESNRLTVGKNPALQMRRQLDTAGNLVVGFANSFIFEFTGETADFTTSIANFAFVQPLLRGAGKHIALESLTQSERNLLAGIRAFSQYQQGFFTQVTIGESAVANVRRGSPGTFVNTGSGNTFVNGFYGLLQNQQTVRNLEISVKRQKQNLEQFEEYLDLGLVGLVQVDIMRQDVVAQESSLLDRNVGYKNAIEQYQTNELGLPPDLPIDIDKSLVEDFTFITDESLSVEDQILAARESIANLEDPVTLESLQPVLMELEAIMPALAVWFENIQLDVAEMGETAEVRESRMSQIEIEEFRSARLSLKAELEALLELAATEKEALQQIKDGAGVAEPDQTIREMVVWRGRLKRLTDRAGLAQARAKLEKISVGSFELQFEDALKIALHNRLDFKNARAALVDTWRQIKIRENQLLSTINLTAAGELYTKKNNPVSFRAETGSLRFGIQFDAPITRLLERNQLKQSLINYQQDKRQFIQSQDRLNYGLRALLRRTEMLRQKLEVDRRQVAIAIRLVDSTQSRLYRPVRPAQPGQSQQLLGETLALNIVNSYSRLAQTQGTFLSTWMQYQAARMRLQRELGIMELDEGGSWVDEPLPPVMEMLQEIEEGELLNTVDLPEGEVDSPEDEKQMDTEVAPEDADVTSSSIIVDESPEEELQGLEKLTQQLINLQQGIEDAVLKRAKKRMDAELEQVLGKQANEKTSPPLDTNIPSESDEEQPITNPE